MSSFFLWCSKTLVPQQPAVLLFMFNWFSDISWFPLNRVDTPLKLNEKFRNNWLKRVHAVFVHYWHFSAKSFSGNWFRGFKKPRVIDYWRIQKTCKSIIIPGYTTQNRKLEVSMTHREKFKFILFLVLFTFILGLGSPAPQFLTISEKFINPIIPLGCALHPRKLHFYDPWG